MSSRRLGRIIGRLLTRAAIRGAGSGVRAVTRNSRVVGWVGEKRVEHILKVLPGEYIVLSNLLLPSGNGTAQIDHVVVSMYGIFVIETKNYHGYIEGAERDRYWGHQIGDKHHKMYNPIMQNQGHIRALKALVGDDHPSVYINLVAFVDEVELNIRSREWVGYIEQLPDVIMHYRQVRLDGRQVRNAIEVLQLENRRGFAERWKHVWRVKQRKNG